MSAADFNASVRQIKDRVDSMIQPAENNLDARQTVCVEIFDGRLVAVIPGAVYVGRGLPREALARILRNCQPTAADKP